MLEISNMNDLPLIHSELKILGGKPCIKGTRISVEFILELIASGATVETIVSAYPHLTKKAIMKAINYNSSNEQ
jgi:uncharacterized protein (DUF433 family)